jgi:hypothetical protein
MEIKVSDEDSNGIKRVHNAKFVLVKSERDMVLRLFKGKTAHIVYAPEKSSDLIGAGRVIFDKDNVDIEWGSATISKRSGFDRPGDDDLEKTTESVRNAVEKWRKQAGF